MIKYTMTFSPGMILCNDYVSVNPDNWIPLCLSFTVLWIWFVWGEDGSGFLSPNQILKYQRRSVPLPAEREAASVTLYLNEIWGGQRVLLSETGEQAHYRTSQRLQLSISALYNTALFLIQNKSLSLPLSQSGFVTLYWRGRYLCT